MLTRVVNEADLETATRHNLLCVVHFSAEWAEQCKQINDLLSTISIRDDYKKAQFLDCPAEEFSQQSAKFKIEAVPTVLFFRDGVELDRVNGVNPGEITDKIKKFINDVGDNKAGSNGATPDTTQSLNERLKYLTNKSKVMLFMKGDRVAPRCGFSKKIVELLNNLNVEYETFDILTDNEVREGLKIYSEWPTYPQLYCKGELLGGLDIVKEMAASGELLTTLSEQ